jgi:GTP cyclohydrolase IA
MEAEENNLAGHFQKIITGLGENATREGLLKTPYRAAEAMRFLTSGYADNPREILSSALFRDDYRQMVIVKDIELYSLC